MRRELDRAKALKRLFDRQRDRVDAAHPDRDAVAARAMDRLVGPRWRVEIQVPGGRLVSETAVQAEAGPAPELEDQEDTDAFYMRVKSALGEIGDHPDCVEYEATTPPNPKAAAARGLSRLQQRLQTLIASLLGSDGAA